jgi:hypothetical protein
MLVRPSQIISDANTLKFCSIGERLIAYVEKLIEAPEAVVAFY